MRRQRRVLGGMDSLACDHDHIPMHITPSVVLKMVPHCNELASFYGGKPFVMLKDAIFEISSPSCHMCEMSATIEAEDQELPVQLIYTNGGGDHRTTFISVQMAYLAHWLTNDFDCLIAFRCPPLLSVTNPCERFMQTDNIGLNGLALARDKMSDANEKEIAKFSSKKKWWAAQKPNDDGKVGSLNIRELLKQTTQFCFESLTARFKSL